jgi:hypothetical protein
LNSKKRGKKKSDVFAERRRWLVLMTDVFAERRLVLLMLLLLTMPAAIFTALYSFGALW